MNYVFDLDGTLCTNTNGDYKSASPLTERILHVNKLYELGHTVIIFTARGMNTYSGDIKKVYEIYYDFTKNQLEKWNVKYTQLILGKPAGDIYIDDKGVKDEDYFRTNIRS
jgi:capsule biosynthesis phosphatase